MITAFLSIAIMGLSISSCQKEETIKIGAILSITGPGFQSGEDLRDAMLLAVEEINSMGGLNRKKIKLIIEDSQSKAQEGKDAFNKIEAAYHPVLYISNISSISISLAPIAEQEDVVLVGLVVSAPNFTGQFEWVFKYYATARDEVPPVINVLKQLKVYKLGILYLNDEYGTPIFQLLKEEFEATGGTVVYEPFEVKVSDFVTKISQLKDTEAIYTVGFVNHLRNVFIRLKEENYDGYIFASEGAATLSQVEGPSVSDGVYLAAPIIHNPNFLFTKEVMEKYETKYDKSLTHQAANGYDFVIIVAGLLEDREISRDNVKRMLEEGFIYSGVFGSINVKPGEHDISFPLHPAQIVDGKIEYLR